MEVRRWIVIVVSVVALAACGQTSPVPAAEQLEGGAPNEPKAQPSTRLFLTVPDMERVKDLPVHDAAPPGYDAALRKSAVHVRGTGFPWEREANVFISGHRLGYPGTQSWKVFEDLPSLEKGDPIIVRDSLGTRYEYEVTRKFIVGPHATRVLDIHEGQHMLTLSTCTKPDYSERVIVRAEPV